MRLAWVFIFAASPAFAHHEAVVVSVLPGLLVWLAPAFAVVATAWLRRRK